MRNNKGFGKAEVLTVIVLLLGIFAFLMYSILGFGKSLHEKISDMKKMAFNFNKVVYTNTDSFKNESIVYLDEAIDLGLFDNVKSPFGSKNCNVTESKVESPDTNRRFVSLRCDDYLIDHVDSNDLTSDVVVYKVGGWSSKKLEGDNVEAKKLYNCRDEDGLVFEYFMEPDYLVTRINKKYGLDLYHVSSITKDICSVRTKTFYRTKEEVKESK